MTDADNVMNPQHFKSVY